MRAAASTSSSGLEAPRRNEKALATWSSTLSTTGEDPGSLRDVTVTARILKFRSDEIKFSREVPKRLRVAEAGTGAGDETRAVPTFTAAPLCALAVSSIWGQSLIGKEPAPVRDRGTLTYSIGDSGETDRVTLTFYQHGSGFLIDCAPCTVEPQLVGSDLRDGESPIQASDLGMLWLPPSERKVGAKNDLGEVTKVTVWKRRKVFILSSQGGKVLRRFNGHNGFLESIVRREGPNVRLVGSTLWGS